MGRVFLVLFFFFGVFVSRGQVVERFGDGNFTNEPSWQGDGADFYVNSSFQLQLRATLAGVSYLSVPITLTNSDSIEWQFYIRQNFAPSSSNFGRIYLLADSADTEQPVNGYYLQFGESLTNDAIELFRQTDSTSVSVCRGINGHIAAAFAIHVRVLYSPDGKWSIQTSIDQGVSYTQEAEGYHLLTDIPRFFSFRCTYTVGNISNFWFDDLYIGSPLRDTIPPSVSFCDAISSQSLNLRFSERMSADVLDVASYEVNGIGHPVSVTTDTSASNSYTLHFASGFSVGTSYMLNISCSDQAGNVLVNDQVTFRYFSQAAGDVGDVIINEIYFEPVSSSPLPYGEFIEVYNRSNHKINLKDWILSDGTTDALLPGRSILPQEYLVLHASATDPAFIAVNGHVGMTTFPTLNNDTGDELKLISSDGTAINQVRFSDASYHSTSKDDGGWSIERMDFNYPCDDPDNWKASADASHGSPGRVNSVSGVYMDTIPPAVLSVFPDDSIHVTITFSEAVTEGIGNLSGYSVAVDGMDLPVLSLSVADNFTSVTLTTAPLSATAIATLQLSGLRDCGGNAPAVTTLVYGTPVKAKPGDVIINEVMNYPKENGTDYVEIKNVSSSLIDLKGWLIKEGNYLDRTTIRSECILSSDHFILWPGRYLLISRDKKKVFPFYVCKDYQAFFDVVSFPDYNSEDGSVLITDEEGMIMDAMDYTSDLHFPLLDDLHGVSLERSSDKQVNGSLWHSAASTAGFGTPGYRNSQSDSEGKIIITTEPEVFSPDNDGYQDLLRIYYTYPMSEAVLSVYIYNKDGRLVRKLVDGETVANEGEIIWNGNDDNRSPAPTDTYIIVADAFDLKGRRDIQKKVVVLVRQG